MLQAIWPQVIVRINIVRRRLIGSADYASVYLLNKYNITPTLDGPYQVANKTKTQGKHGEDKSVGGRTTVSRVLQNKISATKTGQVPAEDQQNDSLYLCPVKLRTPAKTLNLDFDTGSADLWVCIRYVFLGVEPLLSVP